MLEAGGFPVEMPVATLSETFQKPTPMMYRNLLAMETEELLRSYPADGAVLMGGCDKTTPALLMGAASANMPAIYLTAGPMLRGNFRGQAVGSGTDVWKLRHGADLRRPDERTSYGACVLYVAPESFVGGPLALASWPSAPPTPSPTRNKVAS